MEESLGLGLESFSNNNNLQKSFGNDNDLIKGGGEGSRGGNITGHTKDGKPIYGSKAEKKGKITDAVDKVTGVEGLRSDLKQAKRNLKNIGTTSLPSGRAQIHNPSEETKSEWKQQTEQYTKQITELEGKIKQSKSSSSEDKAKEKPKLEVDMTPGIDSTVNTPWGQGRIFEAISDGTSMGRGVKVVVDGKTHVMNRGELEGTPDDSMWDHS